MSAGDKVVGIAGARRRRMHARTEGRLPEPTPDLQALRARIEALEAELVATRESGAAPQGLLVALARIVQEGLAGFGWETLARAWREAVVATGRDIRYEAFLMGYGDTFFLMGCALAVAVVTVPAAPVRG